MRVRVRVYVCVRMYALGLCSGAARPIKSKSALDRDKRAKAKSFDKSRRAAPVVVPPPTALAAKVGDDHARTHARACTRMHARRST